MTPEMENAWKMDEIVSLKQAIARHSKREYWRKIRIDADEQSLPDYERPTKRITWKRKRNPLAILRMFIP